jgi:pyruvate,water dikinase
LARVRAGRGGFWRAPLAARVLELARAYTHYREDQRYALDYILSEVRNLMIEIGRRLVERGRLEQVDDIFFLTKSELEALWVADEPPAISVAERRIAFLADRAKLPPAWVVDGVAIEDRPPQGDDLYGVGASAGCASGPARVVSGARELHLVRMGDVLVAPNTDPGWTPVFPLLKAVVLETGGVLSHGAIIAREYGLPAVTGVTGACERITTGLTLEVDGTHGIVRIAEPKVGS